jgi:CMP-N-acetylneuraminic acid synthetase
MFIPIKENSQRVPRKNFRILDGEPLYKHILLKYFDFEIYVDTDSKEIISEINKDVRLSNVKAYKRDSKLTGDKVSVCELIKNFIKKFNVTEPIIQTHVTSPFLTPEILKESYLHIHDNDSVVSCNKHNSRFWRKESYGFCPINHNPLKLEQTQDLPVLYEENSAFYIFKPEIVLNTGNRIGEDPYFYCLEEPYNIDIDTEKDWHKVLQIQEDKC